MSSSSGGKERRAARERLESELVKKQAEFFESYFRKGAEFTRELLEENERLRGELSELEKKLAVAADERARDLSDRFEEIERENNDLAALYVAQSQLHSTLDPGEVVSILMEVLLNFVGASRFALLVTDGEGGLHVLRSQGLEGPADVEAGASSGRIAAVAKAARAEIRGVDPDPPGSGEPPVVFPLIGDAGSAFGVIAIWEFLVQKKALAAVDHQLFDLLGRGGGLALEAARIATEMRRSGTVSEGGDPFAAYRSLLE